MSFEYLRSSMATIRPPNIQWRDNWKEFYKQQYSNAYNWYDIGEETDFGSEEYQNIRVRTMYVLNPSTGTKRSDDWKACVFEVDYKPKLGRRYKYFDQIWLTVNVENFGSPTSNCVIRRCNTFITMTDQFGNIHKEPCCIDPDLKYGNIYYNNSVDVPQGAVKIWLQLNKWTKNIQINDRYILGYSQVFKVKTVMNYLSDYAFDPNGAPVMSIDVSLDTNQVGDDFSNNTTGSSNIVNTPENATFIGLIPPDTYLSQNESYIFKCFSFNGSQQLDEPFIFEVMDNDIPENRYTFDIINDNSFSITNFKKYATEPLKIQCTNSVTQDSKVFSFILGGEI